MQVNASNNLDQSISLKIQDIVKERAHWIEPVKIGSCARPTVVIEEISGKLPSMTADFIRLITRGHRVNTPEQQAARLANIFVECVSYSYHVVPRAALLY